MILIREYGKILKKGGEDMEEALEIQKVTLEDEEIDEKVEAVVEDTSKGELIGMSCEPMFRCCPNTGWR